MQQQMQMQQGQGFAQAIPVQAPVFAVAQAMPVAGSGGGFATARAVAVGGGGGGGGGGRRGFVGAAAGAATAAAMPAKVASAPLDMVDRSELYDDPKAAFAAEKAAQAAVASAPASAPPMAIASAQPAPAYPTTANARNSAGKAYVLPPGEVQARAQPVVASAAPAAEFVGALPIGAAIQQSAQERYTATLRNVQVSQSSQGVVGGLTALEDLLAKHRELKTDQNRSQLVAIAMAKRQADPKLWDQDVQFRYGSLMRAYRE